MTGWEAERERLRKALERCETLLIASSSVLAACDQAQFTDVCYDDADCDGACLLGDIDNHLADIRAALSESKEQTTADGWIEWKGKERRPLELSESALVEVRFPGGATDIAKVGVFYWGWAPRAANRPLHSDIIAYRPVQL